MGDEGRSDRSTASARSPGVGRAGFAAFLAVALIGAGVAWALRSRSGAAGPPASPGSTSSASAGSSSAVDNPIDHVVYVIKENRSFDNFFGRYPGADGATEGLTSDGRTVTLQPAPDVYDEDLGHSFYAGLLAINGGAMNGFNRINDATGKPSPDLAGYTQYSRETLPAYFDYADRFVVADHFFTSMYGPTLPEHLYTVAAQSYLTTGNSRDDADVDDLVPEYCDDATETVARFRDGLTDAELAEIMEVERSEFVGHADTTFNKIAAFWERVQACFEIAVLPDQLEAEGITWNYYAPTNVFMNALQSVRHVRFGPMWDHVRDPDTFLDDLSDGKLPAVSWLVPPDQYNEHPGGNRSVCSGQNWTIEHLNAIQQSPYWSSTAVVIVWDDFGGLYDHVLPPQVDIMGLGIRTPALIVSPWTRAGSNPDGGSVDATVYEFSSVLRFIEDDFGLTPMTDRDGAADPLSGAFDFGAPPRLDPLILPELDGCPYA
jgi:phospholipase C